MDSPRFGDTYSDTRHAVQRVAAHVLARAQHLHTGRIGLRVTPGGFGTTEFGPDSERIRVSGGVLVHESRSSSGPTSRALEIDRATLGDLARFVGVDLSADFSAGDDTPPVGDADAPIRVHAPAVSVLADWYSTVSRALDRILAESTVAATPTLAQLWPEHFDVALDLAFDSSSPTDRRVNLGGSPGDEFHAEPYLYVGPWTPDRPGEPEFWNAPFGAVIGFAAVASAHDPLEAAVGFFRDGLERLTT